MFAAFGKLVTRYWAAVLATWAFVLIAVLAMAPRIGGIGAQDDAAFLPGTVASQQAADFIEAHFDRPPAMSVAAIVMERPAGLTGSAAPPTSTQPADSNSDWGYIARLTARLRDRADQANPKWSLMSAGDPKQGFLRSVLVSPEEQATVIKIDLPCGFASREAINAVGWIEKAAADANPPAGLNVAVTGSASYGRDSTNATEISLHRTTWVAAIAVVLILLLTYRALPVVGISLVTVAVAVVVAVSIVAIGAGYGWSISVLVELFTIILGFGAGVDFSLFFLSRYHEELNEYNGLDTRPDRRAALVRVMAGTGPAIVASAGTVAAALGLMFFAKFPVFHTAGPAVAISVIVACAASLTLTPALAYLVGSRTFWPQRVGRMPSPDASGSGGRWNRVAAFAVRHYVVVLVVGLIVLAPLAVLGWRQEVVYDTLADLPQEDQSVRGAGIFQRHFAIGEMAPVQVVVQLDRPLGEADWAAVAMAVDRRLAARPTVRQVRSVAHPLGLTGPEISPMHVSVLMAAGPATTAPADSSIGTPNRDVGRSGPSLLSRAGKALSILPDALARTAGGLREAGRNFRGTVLPRHLGRDRTAALWDVALPWPAYSNQALDALAPLAQTVRDAIAEMPPVASASPRVLIAGDTALMRDLRLVTNADFGLIGLLSVATIIVIVTLLIRDLPVALFVMVATILTYGSALGLTSWAFHLLFGLGGPDWKVEFFLFVILVAVGQDYNLFMLTRIMEERRVQPLRPAVQSAIARTGSIISYCGLTMAATLGSLVSSPMRLLQELGTAFIVGLLIDTFLVRPLMVPAFILLFRRMNSAKSAIAPIIPEPPR